MEGLVNFNDLWWYQDGGVYLSKTIIYHDKHLIAVSKENTIQIYSFELK